MKHDGCKLCKYENCSMESKECIGCKQNSVDKYKRMTQGDRIRFMSDEELAEHFSNLIKDMHEHEYCEDVKDWLKWLQSEVEE